VASQNDHTGARLVSKTLSKEGQENWDLIFGKRIKEQKLTTQDMDRVTLAESTSNLAEYELDKSTGEVTRIDIIGQNGNDGDHYGRSSES